MRNNEEEREEIKAKEKGRKKRSIRKRKSQISNRSGRNKDV
jgi:hypothetical protein